MQHEFAVYVYICGSAYIRKSFVYICANIYIHLQHILRICVQQRLVAPSSNGRALAWHARVCEFMSQMDY